MSNFNIDRGQVIPFRMSEIGYQYWLKCRPEWLTFSSIGQDSISLTPAVQQGVAAWWCRRQWFGIDRQGQGYTFLNVRELMKCRPGRQNSVYNGILPPSNKGRGNPSRTGTGPQCPCGADTTGYRQSWDKAWAMWVKYGQKDKTFRTVSGKGTMGISLTSFIKSRGPSPPPTPWRRCPWNIGRGTAIPFKMNETKWTSVLNI